MNYVAALYNEHQETVSSGLPSGEGLTDYLGDFADESYRILRVLFGQETYGIVNSPESDDKALKVLERIGYVDSRNITVITPVMFNKSAREVYGEIDAQLAKLVDIEKRLYRPLINQLGKMITIPDAINHAWIDENIKFVDVDKLRKEMSKMLTNKKKAVDDPEKVDFDDIYDNAKDFKAATEALVKLKDTASRLDLVKLKSSEESLVKIINSFINEFDGSEDMEVKKPITKMLVSVTQALTAETEYLMGLLHYGNIFIVAHNDNIKHIEEL